MGEAAAFLTGGGNCARAGCWVAAPTGTWVWWGPGLSGSDSQRPVLNWRLTPRASVGPPPIKDRDWEGQREGKEKEEGGEGGREGLGDDGKRKPCPLGPCRCPLALVALQAGSGNLSALTGASLQVALLMGCPVGPGLPFSPRQAQPQAEQPEPWGRHPSVFQRSRRAGGQAGACAPSWPFPGQTEPKPKTRALLAGGFSGASQAEGAWRAQIPRRGGGKVCCPRRIRERGSTGWGIGRSEEKGARSQRWRWHGLGSQFWRRLDAATASCYPRGRRGGVREDLTGQMGKWGDFWPHDDGGGS